MDEADAKVSKCVRCGDSATLVCMGCKAENPTHRDVLANTKYCSKACQTEDWPGHKVYCRKVRAFNKGTMDEAEADLSNCARCGNPATKVCKGCKVEDPVHETVVARIKYCSAFCQKEDWPRHKDFCKVAQKLNNYWSPILKGGKTPASDGHDVLNSQTPGPELSSDETEAPNVLYDQVMPLGLLPDNLFISNSCAECQSPASYACRVCKGAPNSTSGLVLTTSYCSGSCQRANWSSHRKTCIAAQARRMLYKLGTELQTRYLYYCKEGVMEMVKGRSLDGGYKIVYKKDSVPRIITATALFKEMDASSEEAETYSACLVGSAHIREVADTVKECFQGKHGTTQQR